MAEPEPNKNQVNEASEANINEGEEGDADEEEYEGEELEEEEMLEEEEPFVSIFEILDAPRELPDPVDLTLDHVKQIQSELGIITLCWPDIQNPKFEKRVKFPESYVRNNNKEKLLLLYAENFRRQFVRLFPHRKPLFLASPNEVGLMVISLATGLSQLSICVFLRLCFSSFYNYYCPSPIKNGDRILFNVLKSIQSSFFGVTSWKH